MTNPAELVDALIDAPDDRTHAAVMHEVIDLLRKIKVGEMICVPATTTDATSGLRFREEHIIVRTVWSFTGQLEQLVMTPTHTMQRRVLDTMERQVREALIAQGWTPPTGAKK